MDHPGQAVGAQLLSQWSLMASSEERTVALARGAPTTRSSSEPRTGRLLDRTSLALSRVVEDSGEWSS